MTKKEEADIPERMDMGKVKVKVYGGLLFALGEQIRVVMAARSINQVANRLGETHYTISRMWGETGNEKEILEAEKHPFSPIVISCLSRNEGGKSIKEFQDCVDSVYKPRSYKRPYIKRS